ncbi:hypothetical protein [Nonomuraea sp. NPDC049158]|uniref:hypothetical protein n=1 Tax=Nonomuraea sp. NPDC049158 TaxID=3155649 RepID=UPI0033DA3323
MWDISRDPFLAWPSRAYADLLDRLADIQAGRVDHPEGWAVSGSLLTDAHRIMILLADGHDPTMVAPAQGPH